MQSAFHAFTWANNLLSGVVFPREYPKRRSKEKEGEREGGSSASSGVNLLCKPV